MEPLVLVIDSNPAVQAIAMAGLKVLGVRIEAMSEVRELLSIVGGKRPRVVICSEELRGTDPFLFCKDLKHSLSDTGLRFILLASSDKTKKISEKATAAGVDYVLYKPFKSDQLRKVVKQLLETPAASLTPPPATAPPAKLQPLEIESVAIAIQNPLVRKIICQLLKKKASMVQVFDSPQEIIQAANGHSFSFTVSDLTTSPQPEWHEEAKMGRLVLIHEASDDLGALPTSGAVVRVGRPLSIEKLAEVFGAMKTRSQMNNMQTLAREEQVQLAARVSASVFEQLLTKRAFRERHWEDAFREVFEEALRICREQK